MGSASEGGRFVRQDAWEGRCQGVRRCPYVGLLLGKRGCCWGVGGGVGVDAVAFFFSLMLSVACFVFVLCLALSTEEQISFTPWRILILRVPYVMGATKAIEKGL